MKVSIVIRSYNEEKHIGRLLSGIGKQTVRDPEIIVVDSGSTDATLAAVSRYPVRILTIDKEEFSFGRSLNVGCRAAGGQFIVLASAHVYPVYNDWLENLLKPFTDPAVALVYGKQRGGQTAKYSEEQIFRKWFPESSDTSQKHPFCNNANCAVRKSFWMQMPYDETLTGLEDLDWAKRVVQKGHRIVYSSDAEIVHIHNETLASIYNRYRREAIALKTIYPQERFNFRTFMRLLAGNCVSDYYHSILEGMFRRNFTSIFLFRLAQFWGTYCGYLQTGQVSGQLRDKFYYPNGFRRSQPTVVPMRSARRIEYSAVGEEV
jgi:glycosyltransferase involved in cell wall biosynthesis